MNRKLTVLVGLGVLIAIAAIAGWVYKGSVDRQNAQAKGSLIALWTDGSHAFSAARSEGVTLDQVRTAVARGADIDARDREGNTALKLSVFEGKLDCVQYLLAKGADVNSAGSGGTTPLMQAAVKGNAVCAKVLIADGADVNDADNNGGTALIWAASSGSVDCVKLLIANGADARARMRNGVTAIRVARAPAVIALLKAAGAK